MSAVAGTWRRVFFESRQISPRCWATVVAVLLEEFDDYRTAAVVDCHVSERLAARDDEGEEVVLEARAGEICRAGFGTPWARLVVERADRWFGGEAAALMNAEVERWRASR